MVVVSGPSGAGKTTVLRGVFRRSAIPLVASVSATTRPPRPGEVDGVDYHFLAQDEFDLLRKRGAFLECFQVFGRGYWYGSACGYRCRVFVGRLHPEPCKDTYRRYKDMPEYWYRDWKERAVFLFAHELWHRWSQKPNGKQQEFDCEIVGMDAIDRWRREQGYMWIPPLCMAEQ